MDATSSGEEPTSWDELYYVNLLPSEIFLKFRKEIQGLRVGINLEVCFLKIFKNLFFDWPRIFGWMGNGLYTSLITFFLTIVIFYDQAFRSGGQTTDMAAVGTVMFTYIIWVVNCQIALTMSHFTWIQHFLIWGSVAFMIRRCLIDI